MTVSALSFSTEQAGTAARCDVMADKAVRADFQGHEKWLKWVQSLLSAAGLMLYRLDTQAPAKLSGQASLQLMSCLPASAAATAHYATVALRSARTDTVVRVKSSKNSQHTVCCIPDLSADKGRRFRHVLVVVRNGPSKMNAQTQTRLVLWAFAAQKSFLLSDERPTISDALHAASSKESPSTSVPTALNALSQWASDQVQNGNASEMLLTQLMDKLAEITGSHRCLLSTLHVKQDRVVKVSLLAVSGQAHIDRRLSAASALLSSVERAFAGKDLPLDVVEENHAQPVMMEKTSIADMRQSCNRLIMPLDCVDVCFAVMLERPIDLSFDDTGISILRNDLHTALTVAHLSDPRTMSMTAATKRILHRARKRIFASVPRSLVHAALLAVVLIYTGYPAQHRISAPLNVEAAERYVLIAPVDGYVESVAVKAGDAVLKGQTLATLDDQDLLMQRRKHQSEAMQNSQAYDKALALHDRVEVSQLKESALLIQTELTQLDMQQQRMTLKAPVDGVVLSGSWDDSLGAAVTTGDTLFTLGSASSHRLVLDVSEYDVGQVAYGQPIEIRLSADPSTVLEATVTAIMPLAVASAGVNSVQVHADLVQPAQLRPGMQGIGKIATGRQIRIMQWAERLGARVVWLAWRLGVLT